MLAKHLGAAVWEHPGGRAEIGYYPARPDRGRAAAAAESWGTPWPSHVYHWHREGFDCPSGAETLATGDDFPTQAISVGPAAYGLQFHPEVTHAMICRWTVRAAERLALPGAQDRDPADRGPPDARSARGALARRLPRQLARRRAAGPDGSRLG